MSAEQQAIDSFVGITGSAQSIAEQYLARNDNDVELAVNDYYNTEHIAPGTKTKQLPTSTAGKEKKKPSSSGSVVRSFSDLRGGSGDGFKDDDEGSDNDMNFFTGGQKSGLAVEDPLKKKSGNGRKLVDDLIEKAQKEAGEPDWRDNESSEEEKDVKKKKMFKGTGHSLGSIENSVESKTILGENTTDGSAKPEKVTRTITFWKEGFSIDEGELYKYDDPKNQEYLKQLNMGRAPLSLLNVQMFQDVDVSVVKKLEDSYYDHQKSKPRVFGFQGEGNRLGSPVPGEPTTVEEAIAKYGSEISSFSSNEKPEDLEVSKPKANNEPTSASEGDTTIQIRLANGERIVRKFNSTDKVEDIYNFVAAKADNSRPWGLVTSFPTSPLDNKKDETITSAGLKNAVIIQRWT